MFHPPPDSPFIDSSGYALEAVLEDVAGDRFGSGLITSLCPRAMMIGVERDDESFAGVVLYQRDAGDLWIPTLTWNDPRRSWEAVPFELREPCKISVSIHVGAGLLDDGEPEERDE